MSQSSLDGAPSADEDDPGPSFHEPVSFSVPCDPNQVAVVHGYLAGLPVSDLGRVVHVDPDGFKCAPALEGWTAGGDVADTPDAAAGHSGQQQPCAHPHRRRAEAGGSAYQPHDDTDEIGVEEAEAALLEPQVPVSRLRPAPPVRRAPRNPVRQPERDGMRAALVACVRRCCGLPSSMIVGKDPAAATANLVGDPSSRARAIMLRFGGSKRDAVLSISSQGGLMCSCFLGTQNALLLSVSGRSSDCKHSALLRQCIVDADVPVLKFQKCMRLQEPASDYAVHRRFGATVVWTALYQEVYSLVTFTPGGVPLCIAPGCRRFRGRCGHVKLVRPLNEELKVTAALDAATGGRDRAPVRRDAQASDDRPPCVTSMEEDQGIEKLPSDTNRGDDDVDEVLLSKRVPRNLMPCAGEIIEGDVWARSADWQRILCEAAERSSAGQPDEINVFRGLYKECVRFGHVRDVKETLMEPYCGSCGTKREERHALIKEPASVYTHQATAPVIQVCAWRRLCCALA